MAEPKTSLPMDCEFVYWKATALDYMERTRALQARPGWRFWQHYWFIGPGVEEDWHHSHVWAGKWNAEFAARYGAGGKSCEGLAREVEELKQCIEKHVKEQDWTTQCKGSWDDE